MGLENTKTEVGWARKLQTFSLTESEFKCCWHRACVRGERALHKESPSGCKYYRYTKGGMLHLKFTILLRGLFRMQTLS